MHEPEDFPEVEDDDLTPATRGTQRPSDEQPPELFWLYVGHVGSKDGGPQDLATYRKLSHILRDDGDLRQLGQLRSSKKRLDVAGDTVLVYARHDSVGGFAYLAGHTSPRDPVPREAEHVYIVVGVAEGEDMLWLDPPPLAQEAEGRRLRAFQTADLHVVRQAARNEEPPGEGRPRLPEPTLYIVGAVHDHEFRRFFPTFPEPIRRGVHYTDARFSVTPEVIQRRGCVWRGYDAPVEEDTGVQILCCCPLEHLYAQTLWELAVQQGLPVHPPYHRTAVADQGVLIREAKPTSVLSGFLESPPRCHDEPHPPLSETLQGCNCALRDPKVPPQYGPVEVEGAEIESQSVLRAAVFRAQVQPFRCRRIGVPEFCLCKGSEVVCSIFGSGLLIGAVREPLQDFSVALDDMLASACFLCYTQGVHERRSNHEGCSHRERRRWAATLGRGRLETSYLPRYRRRP